MNTKDLLENKRLLVLRLKESRLKSKQLALKLRKLRLSIKMQEN